MYIVYVTLLWLGLMIIIFDSLVISPLLKTNDRLLSKV